MRRFVLGWKKLGHEKRLAASYRLPTLSFVGASIAEPCFRLHTPLIEPDVRISRFRLSEKGSRCGPREIARPTSAFATRCGHPRSPAAAAANKSLHTFAPARWNKSIICTMQNRADVAEKSDDLSA